MKYLVKLIEGLNSRGFWGLESVLDWVLLRLEIGSINVYLLIGMCSYKTFIIQ